MIIFSDKGTGRRKPGILKIPEPGEKEADITGGMIGNIADDKPSEVTGQKFRSESVISEESFVFILSHPSACRCRKHSKKDFWICPAIQKRGIDL